MFEIEKGIPVPTIPRPNSGRKEKYPLSRMEVGDSFFIPNMTGKYFSAFVSRRAKVIGFKFCVRSVEGGARVWRIE